MYETERDSGWRSRYVYTGENKRIELADGVAAIIGDQRILKMSVNARVGDKELWACLVKNSPGDLMFSGHPAILKKFRVRPMDPVAQWILSTFQEQFSARGTALLYHERQRRNGESELVRISRAKLLSRSRQT